MPHFPKPFFKKNCGVWYVEIDRKQINFVVTAMMPFGCITR